MCSPHSSEPDSTKPLARRRALTMLDVLRWDLTTMRQNWKTATKQTNTWTVLTWIFLHFSYIPQSAGQGTFARAELRPGSENSGGLRPRSPVGQKNERQRAAGNLNGSVSSIREVANRRCCWKKPTREQLGRCKKLSVPWRHADTSQRRTQRISWQGNSACVCTRRLRDLLCLCRCAGRPRHQRPEWRS